MTRVLLVDWLGRGGIAQTSESWVVELQAAGAEVRVVSRVDRELGAGAGTVLGPRERRWSVASHAALCRFAARQVRTWAPDVVIFQNYVLPALEDRVHRAAERAGARIVFVIHDHRHHEWREGSHFGLDRQLRGADQLVVHSDSVGRALAGLDPMVLPLPVQLGLVDRPGISPVDRPDGRLLALQVGVLNRAYKGTATTMALADEGVEGWAFAFAGVGAPSGARVQSVDAFLEPGDLVAAVKAADAIVLPYREATQSGAVVLAQLCGTVVVASAVGGLSEQIDDGRTGLLVPPDAGVSVWRTRLEQLQDESVRSGIAAQAQAAVWHQHEGFRVGVQEVIRLPPDAPRGPSSPRSIPATSR